jgi:acetyl-CoA acetyltransferase
MLHDGLSRGRYTAGGKYHPVPGGMIETAENLRRDYQITREAQDEFAYNSHKKAAAAQAAGKFDEEIIPFTVKGRKAIRWSTRTSISAPIPRWRNFPLFVPSAARHGSGRDRHGRQRFRPE